MVSVSTWSLAFLTTNTVVALSRARDAAAAAFVASAYVLLLLFFRSVRALEQAGGGARLKPKVWTWTLATALNVLFSRQVAGVMPPVVSAAVWLVSAISTAGGFFILFLHDKTSA